MPGGAGAYYGSGVYRKQASVGGKPNKVLGGHVMLVVGYDDTLHCEEFMGCGIAV